MIVVDTNVIVYLHISSEHSSQAELVFRKDAIWVAPYLWRSEFRNVLALYVRKRLLTLAAAREIVDEAEKQMAGHEFDVDSMHVLNLVAESGCSAYDCEFVVLAQDLGIPLVTVDKKIISQFPDAAIALDGFVE